MGRAGHLAEAEAGVRGKLFQVVHGVNIGRDGFVYVNDRKGNRIQVFEKDGTFVRNIWVNRGYALRDPASPGTSWDLAFSKGDQRLIYVTDGRSNSSGRSRTATAALAARTADRDTWLAISPTSTRSTWTLGQHLHRRDRRRTAGAAIPGRSTRPLGDARARLPSAGAAGGPCLPAEDRASG